MNIEKKTKIVCTIGPATSSVENLSKLLHAGMNMVRLNFSHGDFAEHQEKVDNAKVAMKKTGIRTAIMQDLSGPKIRLGEFKTERVDLKIGDFITITTEKIVGDEKRVSINYPNFAKEMKVGNMVLVDDGKKRFEVVEVKGNDVKCRILVGGNTKGRRGVNLPNADLSISSLTDKDKADVKFGIKNKVDYIAFSFVRAASDVAELRAILDAAKCDAKIISKVETPEAVADIDAIIELSDAIMVARGDLAIEVPAETVPMIQKMIIKKCNMAGKPVITATQMLESMIKSPVPTRAEVSDVANAILDGTDAIMLSEETTLGDYPIEAVSTMARVAKEIEANYPNDALCESIHDEHTVTDAITASVVAIASEVDAKLIVAVTGSGSTARMISRHKPMQPMIALTSKEKVAAQLELTWGCFPLVIEKYESITDIMKTVAALAKKHKFAEKGDRVVIAAGMPFGKPGRTNTIHVEVI